MKLKNIYIPQELIDRLMALSQGRSFAAMVREAIIFYLEHKEKK
jgi:predicted DNA-binding protein